MPSSPPTAPSILLVDDNASNLIALRAVLEPLEVRLVEARSGAEALQHIEQEQFAVVLLDVQMPEMDGFETAKRARTLPNGRDVPILFLTAIYRDESHARRGYANGGADYITKPFNADVLRARVRGFVDLFRQREEAHHSRFAARTRELDEAQRRLSAFERISTAALETDDPEPFLHTLLTIFLDAADSADTASILLREGDELQVRASIGVSEDVEARTTVRVGADFSGKIAETGRPKFANQEQIKALVRSPWLRKRGLRALYGVPLVHDGSVIGVAHIGSTTATAFSGAEESLLTAMAGRAAWVVSRHRARERLYAVLNSAPALISVWRGAEHVCEFANDAYRRQCGGREVIGKRSRDLGVAAELVELYDRVLTNGETVTLDEHATKSDWRGEGGVEERFFNFSLHPLRSEFGQPEAVLSFAVDLTPQVLARRALEQSERQRAQLLELERAARKEAEVANRAKDDFLATVSHELRTPLNAILGWATSLRRGVAKDHDRALGLIERNAHALARIVDDVLDLSRIVSGKLRLEVAFDDISHALFGAVEAVRPAAEAKDVALEVDIDDDLGLVAADGDRIQQIAWNLLSNAVKFTPGGGRVELTASKRGGCIVIRVTDTGQGIAPEFLPHVFEPFRQADASTTRSHGGVGLGLAIVKQLAVAHGGTVTAESAGVDRGATFTLKLPARQVSGFPMARPRRETPSSQRPAVVVGLDDLRVLVVDDKEDSRLLVREVLTAAGATVEMAESAEEAFEAIASFRPHALVVDIAMPKMDGYSFIRALRALSPERGGTIPAMALTAYARADDRESALEAGFQMHVTKPFDPSELAALVAELAQEVVKLRKPA
jgi:signal transduction histidine kinase/DNA-binding response OmpR family regulator